MRLETDIRDIGRARRGVSHRPDEHASPEWIGSGVHLLARILARLAE